MLHRCQEHSFPVNVSQLLKQASSRKNKGKQMLECICGQTDLPVLEVRHVLPQTFEKLKILINHLKRIFGRQSTKIETEIHTSKRSRQVY